jgi:hypothetical protein
MNHPNMSYCQWQNTLGALQQVAADYEERLSTENVEPISREERTAMMRCFDLMRDLMQAANIDDDTHEPGEQALAMLTAD